MSAREQPHVGRKCVLLLAFTCGAAVANLYYAPAYFMGGVVLSAATSALYDAGGWPAVCALGVGTAAIGLLAWLLTEYAMTGRRPLSADSTS